MRKEDTKSSVRLKKAISPVESRVFKLDQILYLFEDNQYVQTGTDEKNFKDAT
jgi:hypothetical protein